MTTVFLILLGKFSEQYLVPSVKFAFYYDRIEFKIRIRDLKGQYRYPVKG